MAERVREVREVIHDNDMDETVEPAVTRDNSGVALLQKIVYIITSVITGLLAIRLLLSLLGANRGNTFASFIYSVTQSLVAPFFGLFNYTMRYGVARFEFETLIAIVVYILLGIVINQILSLLRGDD